MDMLIGFDRFMEDVDREISEMKLSLNARARIVAESYLVSLSVSLSLFTLADSTDSQRLYNERCNAINRLHILRVRVMSTKDKICAISTRSDSVFYMLDPYFYMIGHSLLDVL